MLRLPGGRGAVLVVGVGVMVVHILPGEDGGPRGAAHGRGHEGVDEVRPTLLHDAPCLVHHLHGTCNRAGGEMPPVGSNSRPGRAWNNGGPALSGSHPDGTPFPGRGTRFGNLPGPMDPTGICGQRPARHCGTDLHQEEASWSPVLPGVYGV